MSKLKKNKIIKKPEVSVILPVYNAALYLEECLESIYNQSFKDFEIIAVDDHSTDTSYSILKRYSKKFGKMKIFKNSRNKGVSETAKKAIQEARGEFLARMDADDLMSEARLEKQIKYLKKNEGTVAVGGQVLIIDAQNNVIGEKPFPLSHEEIYRYIFRFVPVQQATLMIAKKRLPKGFQYYRDGMNTAEEVELFFKLFQHGKVENLDSVLHLYRYHDKNTSFLNLKETFLLTLIARIKAVFRYNYQPTFSGIVITFTQALIILILPKNLTILLYRNIREGSFPNKVFSVFKHINYSVAKSLSK